MKNQILIRRYETNDDADFLALIDREGEKWGDYWLGVGREKYKKALDNSIGYLLFSNNELCAYLRCRDDCGFGVYICDLLVDKSHRGKNYGKLLMERVCKDFLDNDVYVLGDVYPYYEKLGYQVLGKVYKVKSSDEKDKQFTYM